MFICSRIKKRRKPRVRSVTLKLCRDRKADITYSGFLKTCHPQSFRILPFFHFGQYGISQLSTRYKGSEMASDLLQAPSLEVVDLSTDDDTASTADSRRSSFVPYVPKEGDCSLFVSFNSLAVNSDSQAKVSVGS